MTLSSPRNTGWVCTREWVQATMGEGAYLWKLHVLVSDEAHEVASGVAFTRLGVRWEAWRARRRLGIRGRVNEKGIIPEENPDA